VSFHLLVGILHIHLLTGFRRNSRDGGGGDGGGVCRVSTANVERETDFGSYWSSVICSFIRRLNRTL
jgi:hypothetical protein